MKNKKIEERIKRLQAQYNIEVAEGRPETAKQLLKSIAALKFHLKS